MPGTVDQALGSNGVDLGALTGPQTVSLTTTSAAAINTRIVVTVGYFSGNGFCSSVSVDGVAAVKDVGANWVDGAVNPGYVAEIWSIPAPGGVAAGATISATWSALFTAGQMGGAFIAAISLAGMDLAVGGGTQATSTFSGAASAALHAGTAIATGDGVAIAMISTAVGGTGGGVPAGTFTTGTQFATYEDATDQDLYDAGYLVLTGSQSVTIAGTFTPTTGASGQAGATVVYSSDGVFTPHRMPLGA